jgi:signal transduction histidine kinase
MDAAWLMRRLRSPTSTTKAMAERLATMESSIDSAITTVRRIATDLRPGMLDDLGLVPALQWQVREYERRFGLTVTFSGPPEDVDVDRPHATAMFRILQELLTNIARHAHAKTVAVNLTATDERLLLEVRDDGRGISDAELSGARSLGLLGMRERAAALGGTCWIAGKPGSGTVARVDLPRADGGPS